MSLLAKSLIQINEKFWNLERAICIHSYADKNGQSSFYIEGGGEAYKTSVTVYEKTHPEAYAAIKYWLSANTIKPRRARRERELVGSDKEEAE